MKSRGACLWILAGAALGLLAALPLGATDSSDELIAREKARAAVEAALETYLSPAPSAEVRIESTIDAVAHLATFGADVVPFLTNELEHALPSTYDFCAYALGHLALPEAEDALRDAITRADEATDSFATPRKAWAGWALALQGHADAVDVFNQGKRLSAHYTMHEDTTVIESAGILTAPRSIPVLLEQLARFGKDEELKRHRTWTVRALRRIADPAIVPGILPFLKDDDHHVRRETARTLGVGGTDKAVAGLLEALGDEDVTVRQAAALALERIQPTGKHRRLAAHLETETDGLVRGAIYRLLARTAGDRAVSLLEPHWGKPSRRDRRHFGEALGLVGGKKALPLLRKVLADRDRSVAYSAAVSLGQIGSDEAVDILTSAVASANTTVALAVVGQLRQLGISRAGPAIAERLVGQQLAGEVTDPRERVPVEQLSQALVGLNHHAALPGLRAAKERQSDIYLVRTLEDAIRRLELIEKNGSDTARWIEAAKRPESDLRRLAYRRLAELGGEPAARGLTAAFAEAESEDRVWILRALGKLPTPSSTALIERVLLDPEFDPVELRPLREMAGWSARRIGGEPMFELLAQAIRRRKGRDGKLLVYAALTGGTKALPLLEEYRVQRMRYLGWLRGREHEKLDWIAGELRAGRASLQAVDVAPELLTFR